ncbi:cytochrome P450 [Panaeolus papilionaceus]|nr:cytochrome P450 [Panaeolus papilionaceus]
MSFPTPLLGLILALFVATRFLRRPKLPPGPKGLPLLGVTKEHPKTEFWKTYQEWGRIYGEYMFIRKRQLWYSLSFEGNIGFISFNVLGRRMVVLNSLSVAEDLLSKRSVVYSDRPSPPMASQLMKRDKSIFYTPYNDLFKLYRRFMHQSFNPSTTQKYWALAEKEARIMVENMVETPEHYVDHLRRNAGALTMKIAYGYTIDKHRDYFIGLAEEGMRIGSLSVAPGKWLVDSFPILMYWPEWLPGGGFKKQARVWSDELRKMSLEPHNYVKKQMAAGTAIPSFTSTLLEMEPEPGVSAEDHDEFVLWTGSAIYVAGADTVNRRIRESVLLLHDDAPNHCRQSLSPLYRCHSTGGLSMGTTSTYRYFHATSEDDEYQGYFIPKNATVIPNIWAMTHDPDMYPDPFTFNPDRFLSTQGHERQRDPRQIIFGFGRRSCPGQHLGDASVFIQIATTLATLELSKPLDANGGVIEPEVGFTTAVVSHVKPFDIRIRCRSQNVLNLIHEEIASSSA